MIKLKDPDWRNEDFIWVIEVVFDEVSLITHHTAEIEKGQYAYLKTGGNVSLRELSELSDIELLDAYAGLSERYGICTVKAVIPW